MPDMLDAMHAKTSRARRAGGSGKSRCYLRSTFPSTMQSDVFERAEVIDPDHEFVNNNFTIP
jgi:hypothetical protein